MTGIVRARAIALCFCAAEFLAAQNMEGLKTGVEGRVVDGQGLAVPKATVSLNNELTGSSQSRIASGDGRFVFAEAGPGKYSLTIRAVGFADQSRRIAVDRQGSLPLGDLVLPVVGIDQSVTVVSASRLEELQQDSPVNTLVVERRQIQNTGYERVGDVLSEIPGVVTRAQSYGVAQPGGEQINGIDSRQVLVLQDGLPVIGARGITEGAIDLNQQEVGRLERIEVVEGAASALYGSDAIGGVVNMITREPANPLDLNASVSGGSLGAVDGRLDTSTKWKNLTAFAALGEHKIDSYTLLPNDPSTVGPDEDRRDFTAKLHYAFNARAALGFTASAYQAHDTGLSAGADPFSGIYSETQNRSNDSTQSYAVVGDFLPANQTTLQVRLYDARFDQNSHSNLLDSGGFDGPAFDPGNLNERYHRADATVGQQLGSWQFLQAGFEWAQDLYRGVNRLVGDNAGDQITTNDVWLQDRLQPFRKLTVTLGGRYQHHSLYGGHLVPKAGVVYRVNDRLTLRAAFGGGFRAPDLGQLYYRLLHLDYGYQVIGNPTLRPETSQSYSAGGTYAAGRFQLGLNLFHNKLNHLIDTFLACDETSGQNCSGASLNQILQQYGIPPAFQYDATGAAFFTFIYRNVDQAFTRGFNANTAVALTRKLRAVGGYTYLEAVDSLNHSWLPDRSRHQGHAGVEYADLRRGLLANLRGNFFSGWPTGSSTGDAFGYQTWNVYVSQRLHKGIQVFGAVNNLADSTDAKLRDPSPSFDRPDYGRTFRIGLRYGFTRGE
jgi:outer membrane receptor for ferrienterochelin and colicins